MHNTQKNLVEIKEKIKNKIDNLNYSKYEPKVIAVSKTFSEQDILPLIEYGHVEFGENKVQEAQLKWQKLKEKYNNLKLHMLGKLQTNKVKNAVEIFDYIHSLDNLKLANKISNEIQKKTKKIKIFIQVNLGDESQKSGINPADLETFYNQCIELKLNIIGTMCIPPDNQDPKPFFKHLLALNQKINLSEISMGMTNDYLDALEYKSTFLRIGTGIFGKRTS
ncbi:YggS family pyridoxal phosphate-dependent enzyme [Candidatus Pelagibacter sp.]|uniref:YggS family pyridoxal phosphate-dependent enzyme n=1 Tax=Candidatus Pelagibacter sp. TaxID=2024849 RepID=UPI003F86F78D